MFVIATAGHVDHGKSTLVRALTGMEPDRWAEERRRGMTIDLGYAWTRLPNGEQIAFVDVPGHERFVTNMLAGVGPTPAVLLVIAADEGWCRQTSEHVAALTALGVEHGVLAVTRADLGDADLAIEEARDRLAGTGLASVEAVAVSPVAGTGLEELRAALGRLVGRLPPAPTRPTRLWIDRVFTVRGAGTVVTGTLQSGSLRVGDEVRLFPFDDPVQVRGLESMKSSVPVVSATARVAVNLRLPRSREIHRGFALVGPADFLDVRTLDVRLIGGTGDVATHVVLHVGSAAVPVRVRGLGGDMARLVLDAALPLRVGERGVLRDPGRQSVVAGVQILDVDPPQLTRRGAAAARAAELAGAAGTALALRQRGAARRSRLHAMGVLDLDAPAPPGTVEQRDWVITGAQWSSWSDQLPALAARRAAGDPVSPWLARATAVRQLALPDPALLDPLIAGCAGLTSDANGVHRIGTRPDVTGAQRAALDRLVAGLNDEPFTAADAEALAGSGLDERHLAVAVANGTLLRIAKGIYLLPNAADLAIARLAELAQPFSLSEARQALRTTRRVAVPLLEWLDRAGATERVDEQFRKVR